MTTYTSTEQFLTLRDTAIRAARTADQGIVDVNAIETWRRVKVHGIPIARYVGKGSYGVDKLRAEIESENEGVEIPMAARWLSTQRHPRQAQKRTNCGLVCHFRG